MNNKELRALAERVSQVIPHIGHISENRNTCNVDDEDMLDIASDVDYDYAQYMCASRPEIILRLLDQLNIAKAALEFYAGLSNWVGSSKYDTARILKDDLSMVQGPTNISALEPTDPYYCGGRRARQALSRLEEG